MSSLPHTTGTASGAASLRERVRQATRQIESAIILEALQQHRWNRRRTAEALRISYRLLMYKMKSCNLRDETVVERAARGNV
jgi:DNA-binding NtrC family response regulator